MKHLVVQVAGYLSDFIFFFFSIFDCYSGQVNQPLRGILALLLACLLFTTTNVPISAKNNKNNGAPVRLGCVFDLIDDLV